MTGPNLSKWAANRKAVILYFMLLAVLAGTAAFFNLGRAEDPVFTIRTMIVRAAWPGATVQDTIDQITERLERKLQEVHGLDVVRSFTRAGDVTVFVDLRGSTTAGEIPAIWNDVRNKISDIRQTMPVGVQGPFFNDRFGDTFGFVYGFTSDGFTHRELRDWVERVRTKLLAIPDVAKIEVIGAQDEEVVLEFQHDRVAALGLDYPALFAAVAAQNAVRPSGIVRTGQENISLRVTGALESEADILDISIPIAGRLIRLGDVARVVRGVRDPPQPSFRVNGTPAIGLGIAMRDSGDILRLGAGLKAAMREITGDLPVGIEPVMIADQATTVDDAIGEFTSSLWQAIAIILVISILSLGLRPGAVVAVSIPLTLAIVMIVMEIADIDLHRISLGALIIALGLLVDDAMTMVDAMMRRLAVGDDAASAASEAYSSLAAPMLIGTLVTIAGFVPIGFAASSAGEYTFSIFAVVTIALIASWFVAVLFAPVVGMAVLRPAPQRMTASAPSTLQLLYRRILTTALSFRLLTILITLTLFVVALWALRFVPQQFFPSSDRTELLIDLTLPQSASIRASEDTVRRLESTLVGNADVQRSSTYVGRGAIRFYLPLNVQLPNEFFAQMVIVARDLGARDRLRDRLERLLEEDFPEVVARVYPLELGPPVGWPVQYRLLGPDRDRLRELARGLADVVASHPDTRRVNFDWSEPARQLLVRIDQDQARRLGYSSEALSAVLETAVSGSRISQMRDGIYLIDVVARARPEERLALDNLSKLQVPLPTGRTVPLSQFATFEAGQEQPIIWRRNRVTTLTVQSDVARNALPESIVRDLEQRIDAYAANLPSGYHLEVGGVAEESAASRASVLAVVPLMILLMATFLMLQLKSFARLAMVALVMPLGMIGVVAALLVAQKPLGFVAILGVLALLGMIAKNAVILISQIEEERAAGADVKLAVIDAAMSRVRPLILTALSTVLGLVPIAPTVFWGPMAFAIMGGLLAATVLTLLLLPVLYLCWFGDGQSTQDQTSPGR